VLNELSLAWPKLQKRAKRQNAAQLLFLNYLCSENRNTGFSCYNVMPLPQNYCLPLDIKDSLKEDVGGGGGLMADGLIGWAVCKGTAAEQCCCC
jgi:hypothetical protein